MKTGLLILIGVIIFSAFLSFVAAVILIRIAAKPRRLKREQSIAYVKRQKLYGEFDTTPKEEVHIPSFDGYELFGFYLPAQKVSNRYVVITHGITDNCYGSVRYANFYHKLGLHVIIYDMRNHGANVGSYTTMGIRECRDLRAVIEYIRERFGENIVVGIHGESLGSATSILCLEDELQLAFCVADCGYSDLKELITYLAKKVYHAPTFLIPLGDKLVKLFYKYSFSEIRPIDNLKKNHTPILFIHGAADTYIPPSMSQDMYDANAGYKEIHFFEGAGHGGSIARNPKKYYEVLKGFLDSVFNK